LLERSEDNNDEDEDDKLFYSDIGDMITIGGGGIGGVKRGMNNLNNNASGS
jgi:hypothetical protein